MYEYKFVKFIFPKSPAMQMKFKKENDEEEHFAYENIINEHAKEEWRLNSVIPLTNPKVGVYMRIGLDLIFERKI